MGSDRTDEEVIRWRVDSGEYVQITLYKFLKELMNDLFLCYVSPLSQCDSIKAIWINREVRKAPGEGDSGELSLWHGISEIEKMVKFMGFVCELYGYDWTGLISH